MSLDERVANAALGASAVFWAIMGITQSAPADRWTFVRFTICALHLTVAGLFFVRGPRLKPDRPWAVAAGLPSFICGGMVMRFVPDAHRWPSAWAGCFALGGLLAAVSLWTLGRSFSILPAVREVVSRGPYRWIRHPAYAGELLMLLSCLGAAGTWPAFTLVGLAIPLFAIRILSEERILAEDPGYARYRQQVRFRLLPGVW